MVIGRRSNSERRMQTSPASGCTRPPSSGHSSPSRGRATSSVTRPPLRGWRTPSTVSGRSAAALTSATAGSWRTGASSRTTHSGSNGSRSASSRTRTSPCATAAPRHTAAPSPAVGQPGSTSAELATRAPAALATAAVSSVDPRVDDEDLVDQSLGHQPGDHIAHDQADGRFLVERRQDHRHRRAALVLEQFGGRREGRAEGPAAKPVRDVRAHSVPFPRSDRNDRRRAQARAPAGTPVQPAGGGVPGPSSVARTRRAARWRRCRWTPYGSAA